MSRRSREVAHSVVFRWWKEGGAIALFPEIPATFHGEYCLSYIRVGQHAAADYHGVVNHSRPATPAEYAALADELTRLGYRLTPLRRASRRHHRRRSAAPSA